MSEFENSIRDNGSQIKSEAYSRDNLKWLQRLIYDSYKDGNPKVYDIRVNDEIVVSRNTDSRKFDNYLKYFNDTTQVVEVRLYQGNSPNCNKYRFITEKASALSGVQNVNSLIQQALEEDRRKRENLELRTENQRLRRKLKKLKIIAEKSKPVQQIRGLLSEVGAAYQTMKGVRPLEGLDQADQEDYTEVSVEVEGGESPSDQVYQMVKQKLGEENTLKCYQMINELGQDPELFAKMQKELQRKKQQDN